MKKWIKSKKALPTGKPTPDRCAYVRNQLRKLIDGLEAEDFIRTQYQKKQKQNFFKKFSYV